MPNEGPLKKKEQSLGDAFIQSHSGDESRQSLDIYSKISLTGAQKEYAIPMKIFPI